MSEEDTPAEKRDFVLRALCADFMELAVNAGIVGSVIEDYPEHVQENFHEKIEGIREQVGEWTGEIQEFGSAFDGD